MQNAIMIFEHIRPWLMQLSDVERLRLIRAIAGVAPETFASVILTNAHPLDPEHVKSEGNENVDETAEQLLIEQAAWYRRPQSEKMQYQNEFVALYRGEVVDHDQQRLVLLRRVRQQFGQASIAILPAEQERIPEFVIHHPQVVF